MRRGAASVGWGRVMRTEKKTVEYKCDICGATSNKLFSSGAELSIRRWCHESGTTIERLLCEKCVGALNRAFAAEPVFIIFDGSPGPARECCFVEVEDSEGRSVGAGEWKQRDDGLWSLGPYYAEAPKDCPDYKRRGEGGG